MTARSPLCRRHPIGPMLAALIVILVWSTCFVAIRASGGSAPPRAFAALRALVAGGTLLPLAGAIGRLAPPPGAWAWIVALGLANTTLGLSAMFLAVGLAGAALPAVLANSQALLVAPMAALLFREPLGPFRLLSLVAGLSGVGVILGGIGDSAGTTEGAVLGLVAAVGLAVANLIIRHLGARVDALTATTWQYLLGAVPLVAWSLMDGEWARIAWNAEFAVALAFLGVVASAGASYVWYRLVQRGELIRLNALTLLTPFFSVLLALALYGEPIGGGAVLGAILILAGVTGVAWPQDRRDSPAP